MLIFVIIRINIAFKLVNVIIALFDVLFVFKWTLYDMRVCVVSSVITCTIYVLQIIIENGKCNLAKSRVS